MRRSILGLLGATVLTVASAHLATAADLPAKAPPYAPVPSYNWSGFYIGGNVGGAWNQIKSIDFNTATGAVDNVGSERASSFIGGGQVGYNWMATPNWVLGIEADISAASLASIKTPFTDALTVDRISDFGTGRGRLGYAWQNWMLYGTGGYAWAYDCATRTQIADTETGETVAAGTVENSSKTPSGWTIGGGLEWGFARNWSTRAEYLYMDFGSANFDFPLAQRLHSLSTNVSVARVGLNYGFN